MRLRERDKREIRVHPLLGLSDDAYMWGAGKTIRAAVYPAGRNLDPKIYGDRVKEMRLMLYDGDMALEVGMGVSLDAALPAWRITEIEAWDHKRIVLEWIPPGRRG